MAQKRFVMCSATGILDISFEILFDYERFNQLPRHHSRVSSLILKNYFLTGFHRTWLLFF